MKRTSTFAAALLIAGAINNLIGARPSSDKTKPGHDTDNVDVGGDVDIPEVRDLYPEGCLNSSEQAAT